MDVLNRPNPAMLSFVTPPLPLVTVVERAERLDHLAHIVVGRIRELLEVPVAVVDHHGLVIASSTEGQAGYRFVRCGSLITVPLRAGGEVGEIVIGPLGNENATPPRVMQALAELIVGQVAGATNTQPDRKSRLVHDLLLGLNTDETAILREALLLHIDLTQPRTVLLIDASAYIIAQDSAEPRGPGDDFIQQRVQMVIRSVVAFFHLPNDTICSYLGDGQIALLKASNTRNLASWAERLPSAALPNESWANLPALRRAGEALLQHLMRDTGCSVSIGVGRYHPGVFGLARSYQDAQVALALGCRFHGTAAVHSLDQLGIAAFVGISDERTKLDLALHLLSPLDHEPELLTTLARFFQDDCCATTTARRLSIHRNTLAYRCEKIALLTGLDPRRFDDAVQIRLALLLRTSR